MSWWPFAIMALCGVAGLLLGIGRGFFHPDYDGAARSDGPSGAWLAGVITDLRKEKKLVGLAARVVVDGKLVACAADGERKQGSRLNHVKDDSW